MDLNIWEKIGDKQDCWKSEEKVCFTVAGTDEDRHLRGDTSYSKLENAEPEGAGEISKLPGRTGLPWAPNNHPAEFTNSIFRPKILSVTLHLWPNREKGKHFPWAMKGPDELAYVNLLHLT